jgi:hypothetical protein
MRRSALSHRRRGRTLRAARKAIDAAGGDTLLVGRAENFFAGRPDLDDTIARLKAYAEAGADCLYAPGIKTREQIAAVVAAVAPKPVNLLSADQRAHDGGHRRTRRAARQRGRRARARGLGRLHPRRAHARRAGAFRRLRGRRTGQRTQCVLPPVLAK